MRSTSAWITVWVLAFGLPLVGGCSQKAFSPFDIPLEIPGVQPQLGSPLAGHDEPVPELESPPETNAQGCVAFREADRFIDRQTAYWSALERRSAAQNGWKILEEVRPWPVRLMEPSMTLPNDPDLVLVARTMADKRLYRTFYIDQDHSIFTASRDPKCVETKQIEVCGPIMIGGCGAPNCGRPPAPDDARVLWYARASPQARFIGGEQQVLTFSVPVCYRLHSEHGVSRPP